MFRSREESFHWNLDKCVNGSKFAVQIDELCEEGLLLATNILKNELSNRKMPRKDYKYECGSFFGVNPSAE